ncbi:Fe(3+) ABC transporter substrate-binding protein [Bacillus canaveralius]|uniref:Fe(3+) ABC transporter substrate-binding protein n=1 Tax=Bacillus canaveralius TaxID=1403243 RepID=A0A2N5GSL5_9BACI|nr:extracellular solute-binding protein [Bacillus canaveralius]PLR86762.1 Fe(3+) ABC transporter substrate-binding protein [Bacillus canaveralius]PLR92776.1 Fe(3+) ABC transporter substrate-binding protein [Bacillus canaveralius]
MRKWAMTFIVAVLMTITAACGNNSSSSANDGGAASDTTAEANEAELEGTLNFYTSQPDEDAAKLVEGFQAKYPKVKVETFRSGTEEVISKIKAEQLAGDIQADVLLVADAVTFESLKEEDLLLSYESPEAEGISKDLVDPDRTYYGTKVMATALVVNTENVNKMPSSWDVLTSAESKGKVIMPSPLYSGAAAYNLGVLTRHDDFGWDFYEKISSNEVTVTKGNGDVLKSVAGGEKDYGMVVDFVVARAKSEGSPVELVYPQEGVPVITEPIGIMKDSQNEAAAKAFVDFVLSEEGQKLAAELGYTPIREGVEAPEGLKTIDELKVISADINELFQSREDDKRQFEQTVGQ